MQQTPYLRADTAPAEADIPASIAAELTRQDTLILTELVLPGQANHYGTLFGPNGLALLGKAAYLVATRFTGQAVVMVAATRIEFLRPVPVGAVLKIVARVIRVGRSSLTAHVVASFDAMPGACGEVVLRGDFDMVAVDEHGRPTAVTTRLLNAAATTEQAMVTTRS